MLQITSHMKIELASVVLALFTRHVELSTCYGFGLLSKRIHIFSCWSSFAKKIFSPHSCIIILLAHFVMLFWVYYMMDSSCCQTASYDGIPCSYIENEIKKASAHKYSYASWILHSKVREDLGP